MPHIQLAAEKIYSVFGLPLTNTLLMSWIVVFFLLGLGFLISSGLKTVPSGIQNAAEIFVEKLLDVLETVLRTRQNAERFLPLIAAIFLFVLFSNWFGLFPGVGSVGFTEERGEEKIFVPLLRSAASDLNFTFALALVSVAGAHIFGAARLGFLRHASRFFSFKSPMDFFIGLLELLSEIGKMLSFSFRLFGNVFAGEVLLALAFFFVPFALPVPFLLFEVFVGLIQAFIFAMLTAVFIGIAISETH